MKTFQRSIAMLLAVLMLLCLAACGESSNDSAEKNEENKSSHILVGGRRIYHPKTHLFAYCFKLVIFGVIANTERALKTK